VIRLGNDPARQRVTLQALAATMVAAMAELTARTHPPTTARRLLIYSLVGMFLSAAAVHDLVVGETFDAELVDNPALVMLALQVEYGLTPEQAREVYDIRCAARHAARDATRRALAGAPAAQQGLPLPLVGYLRPQPA
jgi:hypothetical protein